MNQSLILVALTNDGRPSFLLWLRLRLLVVFGEGIQGCSRCNSAINFIWVKKLPRLHVAQMWKAFSFKYRSMALCMILRDSSWLVSLFLFVTFDVELYTQDLVLFLRRCLFLGIFFKMAGSGLAPASEDVHSLAVLWSGSKDYICLFTATELRSCIALFETTLNQETCTFLRWLWICWCVVFVCLGFAGLDIIRILNRCRRKNVKTFVKMDTECWKLLVK